MQRLGHTPPFRGQDGKPLADSIAEIAYHRLGGVDQWVMIRGESVDNPPLILLHGGPGFSETGFFRYHNASLEKSFTVVYWDQRGAGKSFDPDIPSDSMTVEQFITDLDELVEVVCKRLGKTAVVLFGHSWGSALGVLYAARFPEKVAAYVGSGQLGSSADAESASYTYALATAERRGKRKAVKKLREIGPPPYSTDSLFAERTLLQRMEGHLRPRALWKLLRMILASRESSLLEVPGTFRRFRTSHEMMWNEVSRLNLIELAPALKVPVLFFLGRKDRWVPPETSVAYFDVLAAPMKKLVWFEHSGHEPFADEPARFNSAMVELVRPLVMVGAPTRPS
jgi:pimeloyl-ACP methyl ester carboxylesterase